MASRKISELTALTAPATADVLPIVDVSEAAPENQNKKITYGELLASAPAGTAAAPSISFANDPNTGIYSPGADQVAISTGGTGRLFVDASGNVGVGTAPDQRLTLSSAGSTTLNIYGQSRAAAFSVGVNATGSLINEQNNLPLVVSTNNQERLRITSAGLVGIGTSAPVGRLHSVAATTNAALTLTTPGTGNARLVHLYGGNSYAYGVVGIAAGNGTQFGDAYSLGSSSNSTGSFSPTLTWTTSEGQNLPGRVGIGTTSPVVPLHVVGSTETLRIQAASNNFAFFRVINDNETSAAKALNVGVGGPTASSIVAWQNAGFIDSETTNGLTLSTTGGPIVFAPNGRTEKARIDSSGRLLVGTASARDNFFNAAYVTSRFQVEGTATANSSISCVSNNSSGNNAALILAKSNGASVGSNTLVRNGDVLGGVYILGSDGTEFVAAASITGEVDGTPGANVMPGRLVFSTTSTTPGASPTERMRITSDAYVRLASGTGGIQFNGDTAAANALDDYEEGTFTPTVFGSTAGGTTTYSAQTGRYTKVGRVVHIQLFLDWTNATGTGFMRIGGLPFTAASDATYPACAIGDINNIALTANNVVLARVEPSTTNIFMAQYPVGGGASSSVGIDTAGFITLAGSYIV